MPADLSIGRPSEGETSDLVAVSAPGVALVLPELVGQAGQDAAYRTLEFFTSCIPNPNTREVYGQAVREFCAFCTRLDVPVLATYVLGRKIVRFFVMCES